MNCLKIRWLKNPPYFCAKLPIDKICGRWNNVAPRSIGPRRKFHYTTSHTFLSSEICEKTAQNCIPKLVQNYLLIFLKTFAIIYLQGKERGKESHGSTAVPKRYKNSKKIFFSS